MRVVDFETILAQSLQLCGLDRQNLSDETFFQIRDFANFRLRYAWEFEIWPELIRTTKMTVQNSNEVYYAVIPNNGIVTNSEGTFKIDIGTIISVTAEDPRIVGKVKDIDFSFDEYEQSLGNEVFDTVRRIIINNKNTTEIYVTYRISVPELIGNRWSSGNYYKGQTVYWSYSNDKYFAPTTGPFFAGKKGNFWKCIADTTTQQPNFNNSEYPTVNDHWEKVKIPQFLSHYLIKGIHADWLKSELQIEQGMAVEREAQALLDLEIHKAIVQQNRQPRLKFNQTY